MVKREEIQSCSDLNIDQMMPKKLFPITYSNFNFLDQLFLVIKLADTQCTHKTPETQQKHTTHSHTLTNTLTITLTKILLYSFSFQEKYDTLKKKAC